MSEQLPLPPRLIAARKAIYEFDWDISWRPDAKKLGLLWQTVFEAREAELGTPLTEEQTAAYTREHQLEVLLDYYSDEFEEFKPLAHEFVAALSEAGGQRILAERAGMTRLDSTRWPSRWVHYGPLPLPDPGKIPFDRFVELQGGRAVAGAQLLWWFAAAYRPWDFGYCLDHSGYIWDRVPLIYENDGEVVVPEEVGDLIPEAAGYVCDLLASGEHSREKVPPGRDSSAGDRASMVDASVPGRRRPPSTRDLRDRLAIGKMGGGRWCKFERRNNRWRDGARFSIPRGNSTNLLEAFITKNYALSLEEGLDVLLKDCRIPSNLRRAEVGLNPEASRIMRPDRLYDTRLRPAISRLNDDLCAALKLAKNPIVSNESGDYELNLTIGFAVEGDENDDDDNFDGEKSPQVRDVGRMRLKLTPVPYKT
jgi:hypothetical protein